MSLKIIANRYGGGVKLQSKREKCVLYSVARRNKISLTALRTRNDFTRNRKLPRNTKFPVDKLGGIFLCDSVTALR